MAAECDETDELSGEIDLVSVAICPLIEHIFAVTAPDSAERKRALTERFVEAKMLHARLKNPESVHALDTARRALVEEFGALREAA